MNIVVWLRSLGLGKHEAAFRENDIDETVLPSLTHETLKELGVMAVGHRLKLLDAIATLRAEGGAKAPSLWGRQRFGGADISAEQRLADLENTLALVKLDPAENVPLLASMLDIPLPSERSPT